jgi:transposase
LDKPLGRFIKNTRAFSDPSDRPRSVPGIGPNVTCMIVACLPELGTLNRQRIAALAGAAPLHRDRGESSGKRFRRGGRIAVRCALSMATLAATRFNPLIRALHERPRVRGNPAKAALVACMRKLPAILDALPGGKIEWRRTSAAAAA